MSEAATIPSTLEAGRFAAVYGENFGGAEQLVRIGLERVRLPEERYRSHQMLGTLALASGHWNRGMSTLATARREAQLGENALHVEVAARTKAVCAALSVFPATTAEIAAIRAELVALDAAAERPGATPPPTPQRRLLRRFEIALLDARSGAYGAALREAGELERLTQPPNWGGTSGVLVRAIRATVAAHRGNASNVLTELGPARADIPLQYLSTVGFADVYSRWLRAEALRQLGRDEEALRWYIAAMQVTNDIAPLDLILLAPSYLRRAEINERLGNREAAVEQYARYRALWGNAEPATRAPMLAVEQQLEKLRSDAP